VITPNDQPSDLSVSLFVRIRQVDEDGLEFWSARDLMRVLEYTDWRNFKGVLIKGQVACENSGHDPTDHFVGASKMVALGSDAKREVEL
jgi:DNA-damage-inducible protein D